MKSIAERMTAIHALLIAAAELDPSDLVYALVILSEQRCPLAMTSRPIAAAGASGPAQSLWPVRSQLTLRTAPGAD